MNWNYVDKILNKYLLTYKDKQRELKDNIQGIFNLDFKYDKLFNKANNNDISRFKRYLDKNKEFIKRNNYIAYISQKKGNKTKITYDDILKTMLYVEYAKFETNIYENQFDTFYNISKYVVNSEIEKVERLNPKKKRLSWTPQILLAILLTPNNMGNTWQEYTNGVSVYNSEEIYKQATIDLRKEKSLNVDNNTYREIFKKQQKREINKKLSDKNDKFMGQIDNEDNYLINQEKLYVYLYYGVKKVQFKAVIDDRTTETCENMNNKVFDIDKLTVGENLPPLHYNCRSYIEPYKIGD